MKFRISNGKDYKKLVHPNAAPSNDVEGLSIEGIEPLYLKFGASKPNPDYQGGLINLSEHRQKLNQPLCTCLKNNNAGKVGRQFFVVSEPKNLIQLVGEGYDPNSGEIVPITYQTNELKSANYRRRKVIEEFAAFYDPLFYKREISVFEFTLTNADEMDFDIRRMVDSIKYRFKSIGKKVRGYLWVLDLSSNRNDNLGYFPHYHLLIVCDRINIKGGKIPSQLKMENVWGSNTHVSLVRNSLSKWTGSYLSKNNFRVIPDSGKGIRMYGKSMKLR